MVVQHRQMCGSTRPRTFGLCARSDCLRIMLPLLTESVSPSPARSADQFDFTPVLTAYSVAILASITISVFLGFFTVWFTRTHPRCVPHLTLLDQLEHSCWVGVSLLKKGYRSIAAAGLTPWFLDLIKRTLIDRRENRRAPPTTPGLALLGARAHCVFPRARVCSTYDLTRPDDALSRNTGPWCTARAG